MWGWTLVHKIGELYIGYCVQQPLIGHSSRLTARLLGIHAISAILFNFFGQIFLAIQLLSQYSQKK